MAYEDEGGRPLTAEGRPYWREPHPVTAGSIIGAAAISGLVLAVVIMAAYGNAPLTLVTFTASCVLGGVAMILTRYGIRGAGVGTAAVAATAAAIALAAAAVDLAMAVL
ncbi:hypothetical protein [Haloglycomyces albus]|uniref:hypothetical protein n=1 Tax=Haloglycomyces albus TaxID=526067 RepID=UPI00046D4486|nr:hypothetical protein [Haloglycomyces albus]